MIGSSLYCVLTQNRLLKTQRNTALVEGSVCPLNLGTEFFFEGKEANFSDGIKTKMAKFLRRCLFQQQSLRGISTTLSRLASSRAAAENVTLEKTDSLVQPLEKKSGRPRTLGPGCFTCG